MATGTPQRSSRILTLPNLISALRVATVPIVVALILDADTSFVGLLLLGVVLSTDWVDGTLARRTGQESEVGALLDPVADRLAIAAGLGALATVGAFPAWAATLIIGRDALALVVGLIAFVRRRVRIEIRRVGKIATFALMLAIGGISWSGLGGPLAPGFLVIGWICYAIGIVEYFVAGALYASDLRRAMRRS